jgi:hypothetical protein
MRNLNLTTPPLDGQPSSVEGLLWSSLLAIGENQTDAYQQQLGELTLQVLAERLAELQAKPN